MRTRLYLLLLAMLLPSSVALLAQATASGSIAGVVTDATGAGVPNVSVSALNISTNASRNATTNGSGEYRFDLLPVGSYTISAQATGFSAATVKGVELLVGTTRAANVTLRTGGVTTTVDVSAVNQLVDSEKTDSSTAVTPQEITDLPLNGRDFANLAILAPGVKQVDSYDPTKNRYAIYAVNGSSGRNTNTTVNGIDNKDNTVGGAVMQLPLEAVQEFKISTNRFSAENGRSEGAALNVVTKAGSNQYHGSLYAFLRNQAYQANDKLSVDGGQPKPDYSRQQYGGSVGGYFRRDKDFGFFAYEGLRERSSITVTQAAFDELTLAAPLGAQPVHSFPTPFDEKRYNGRVDHFFSSTERAFFSYSAQDNKSANDQANQQADASEGNFTINDLILSNFTLSSIVTPSVVNNFTAGFQYWNNLIDSKTRTPYFLFPSGASFGTNINVPQKSSQHKFQFRDDVSMTRGKHTLRAGADFIYEPQVGGFFENNPTPEFDFFDSAANLLNPALYPSGFSSPGAIQNSTGTSGDPNFNLSPKMLGFYMEDDWRATRRLLFNIGLRYDRDIDTYGINKQSNSRTHQELIAAAATNVATVPTSGGQSQTTGTYIPSLQQIGGIYTGLPKNDPLNISPRVGFSFDLTGTGRLILRGGYGLYFGQSFENIPLFMIQQANDKVFANTYSISCAGPKDTKCSTDNNVPGTGILLSNYRYGVDPAPVIPPASFNLAPGSTGRLMDVHYRNPYTQQINFGLQYAITTHSVFELEYVQSRGIHENKTVNINPTQYFLPGSPRPFSAAFVAAGVPKLGRIADEQSIGRSYYDGLNLSYRQSLYKHLTATVNYTFAKALAFEGNPAAFRNTATNPFLGQLRGQDYGRAPNDERHHITAAATVTLPFRIEVSPILSIGSARPVDIQGSTSDLWGIGSGRSNPHAAVLTGQHESPQAYLAYVAAQTASGLSAKTFYQTCLTNGSCREVSYDSYHGQMFAQVDGRVGKTISFRERYNVNVFFQGFDLTNRANFGANYDGVVTDAAFLKPKGYITPQGTIIPHSFTGEFGARFSF